MNSSLTKTIAFAATTAASTALLATTVAIKTATAAIFTANSNYGLVTIDFGDEESLELEGNLSQYNEVNIGGETLNQKSENGDYIEFGGTSDGQVSRVVVYETSFMENEALDGVSINGVNGWESLKLSEFSVQQPVKSVPEPSFSIALGVLGLGAVASRLRRRS